MTDDTQYCGWPTKGDGSACEHPATGEDGRCWIPTHGDPDADPAAGRPSKFNADRATEAIEAARTSLSKSGCARAAGVDPHTLNRWLDKNPTLQTPEGDEVEFRQAFTRARWEGEQRLIERGLSGDANPQMAKFLLATSYHYVKTERREVGIDDEYDFESDGFAIEFTEVVE